MTRTEHSGPGAPTALFSRRFRKLSDELLRSDAVVFPGELAQTFCEFVGRCLSLAGIDAPSGCIEPFCAVSSGVDVDADEDDVGFA